MRKVLVVLLAALLLLFFTSCNQDKIDNLEAQVAQEKADNEAIIENYQNFMRAANIEAHYRPVFSSILSKNSRTSDIDGAFTLDETNTKDSCGQSFFDAEYLLESFVTLEEGESITISEISAVSGTITGKNAIGSDIYDINLTLKDVTIKFKYNILDENNNPVSGKQNKEITLVLNGNFVYNNADLKAIVTSCDITINKQNYKMSYTKDSTNYKVTAAKVNGNDVELRLLNSSRYLFGM